MSMLALRSSTSAERMFALAMALLGAVAAAQVIATLYLLTRPQEKAQTATQRAAVEARLFEQSKASATPVAKPVQLPAVVGVPSTTVRPVATPPESVAGTLLQLAKNFRQRGDTTNAIAKLQQATALDPGNAEILAELALTYESMQLFDRSNEVWRRLQSLGAGVGPLYDLAELKLRGGIPVVSGRAAASNSGVTEAGESAEIPEGSTFGISEATLKRETDPEAETKLLLRIAVKVRPDAPIDHTKVKIQVFFYDVVNNDKIVLTDADVSYEWVTPGHDWADSGTEVLDVTYLRLQHAEPSPDAVTAAEVPESVEKAQRAARKPEETAGTTTPSESGPRQFLGYIVRVYYKDQLQAVRADPRRLLDLFPPPYTAPPQ
ncbi:MAG TPA: tetratricopeptide repeat protein [Chthoniobacterales bacterium]